jgi:hypothetical protein
MYRKTIKSFLAFDRRQIKKHFKKPSFSLGQFTQVAICAGFLKNEEREIKGKYNKTGFYLIFSASWFCFVAKPPTKFNRNKLSRI